MPTMHVLPLALVMATSLLAIVGSASAQSRENLLCTVTKKSDSERDYLPEYIAKLRFAVRLRQAGDKVIVERCSFSASQNRVTCDPYVVDQIAYDPTAGITKYYLFRSHFDLQVFSSLAFVENNGRGSVAWGQCTVDR